MAHPFPPESVEYFQLNYKQAQELYPHFFKKPVEERRYAAASKVMQWGKDHSYGFKYNLLSGAYAPWPHEAKQLTIPEQNCTTIIPWLYLMLECEGITPQIVQFINFHDSKEAGEKDDSYRCRSHFALIVDVGIKHPYLLDPFWNTIGPILEQTGHFLRIGKNGKYRAHTREFEQLLPYTPEEFSTMMQRLHEPAASLDMLVAGQKLYDEKPIYKVECGVMLYYDDTANTFTTRVYIPHIAVQNKAIYATLQLDDAGRIQDTSLCLVWGKGAYWTKLQEEKTIARTDFSTLQSLRKYVRKVAKEKEHPRLGPVLQKKEHCFLRSSLLEIVDGLWKQLNPEEQQAIRPQVLARTLYEAQHPCRRYVYSERQRDSHLRELYQQNYTLLDQLIPLERTLNQHEWKLQKISETRKQKLSGKEQKINRENKKVVEEINRLNCWRDNHAKLYHRLMDQVLFAKTLKGSSPSLEEAVTSRGLDWHIGYLAMVADFLPFVFKARDDLELKPFLPHIQPKVVARREKMA